MDMDTNAASTASVSVTGSMPSDAWQRTIAQPYDAVDVVDAAAVATHISANGAAARSAGGDGGGAAQPTISAAGMYTASAEVPSRGPSSSINAHGASSSSPYNYHRHVPLQPSSLLDGIGGGGASSVTTDRQTYTKTAAGTAMHNDGNSKLFPSNNGFGLDSSAHTFLVGSQGSLHSAPPLAHQHQHQHSIGGSGLDTTLTNGNMAGGGRGNAFDAPGANFPSVALSVSDLNILHATAVKLSSIDTPLVAVETPCKFFKEILLQDFPAEVFLQHPGECGWYIQTPIYILARACMYVCVYVYVYVCMYAYSLFIAAEYELVHQF